jgi:hypothetical protein
MMNKNLFFLSLLVIGVLTACNDDDDNQPAVEAPVTYSFERNGNSTVSFSGQTTRLKMGEELVSALTGFSASEETLLEMYRKQTAEGEEANPFAEAALNESTKSIKSKVAASRDLFSTNTTDATVLKNMFETWIIKQVEEVFPNEEILASPGTPGQIADGSATRYINAQGLEYDQAVNKGLIGALMVDQMLNNYLSTSVLDEGTNIEDNDNQVVVEDQSYTNMEHKWDEAYGYAYGTSADTADPNKTIGTDDSFLNKYIGRVEGDEDFAGIAAEIFDAFKLGRAAIVAGDYDLRDEQADIIREAISEIIAIRAVYYLEQGKNGIANENYGTAFHDISEGYGFIFSLQFTHNPATRSPYFTKAEVDAFLSDLMGDGANGLWDVKPETLDALATAIAAPFNFSIEQAGN